MRQKLVAGNWKMHGGLSGLSEFDSICKELPEPAADVLVCPPATLIAPLAVRSAGSPVAIGAQNCHADLSGAHTGDLSAEMLADAGATTVIVGHSERRSSYRETDADVRAKSLAAWRAGLTAIVCVGESENERESGLAAEVVSRQILTSLPDNSTADNTVVAYEPVWAIGTGRTPAASEIVEIHSLIHGILQDRFSADGDRIRILYGGSVKRSNASEIFSLAHVDGGLVGGASLKAEDFLPIVAAASR